MIELASVHVHVAAVLGTALALGAGLTWRVTPYRGKASPAAFARRTIMGFVGLRQVGKGTLPDEPFITVGRSGRRRPVLLGAASALACGLLVVAVFLGRPAVPGGVTGKAASHQAEFGVPYEEALRAAIQRNPEDLEIRLDLAGYYLGQRDPMAGWVETERVLARSPDHPRALDYAAVAQLAMGQPDVAFSLVKRAMASAPDEIDSYLYFTMVSVWTHRQAEADEAMAEASRRFPRLGQAFVQVLADMRTRSDAQRPADVAGGQ